MEFTYVLLINIVKLILIPISVFFFLKKSSLITALAMTALLDFIVFNDELLYYESTWIFLLLMLCQLIIFGLIFLKSNKQ